MNSHPHTSPLLLSILAALSGCSAHEEPPVVDPPTVATYQGDGCIIVEESTAQCASGADVQPDELFAPWTCDVEVLTVDGDGTLTTVSFQTGETQPACCYPVTGIDNAPGCVIGRPYFERGMLRMAPLNELAAGLPGTPMSRGAAWALAGAGEHASVAAFARLSLQLMACGAPSDLLSATHQAAVDEVKHAEACWELAERFGTPKVRASAFPFDDVINPRASLAELASATLREGCLAETLGAHLAAMAAERAADPEVKRVLGDIADEEARHSVLSFRIVAWAMQAGGPEVRAAIEAALAEPWPQIDVAELALRTGVPRAELAGLAAQGVAQVLAPAVRRLMA
jgi:hypothetical protein